MNLQFLFLLVGAALFAVTPTKCVPNGGEHSFRYGDVRNCLGALTDSTSLISLVLPGYGFDNLRNQDMSQVYVYNYSLCKTTNDGKFIFPDDMLVIPVQQTNLRLFGEYFDHWDNYSSLTASSINVGASFLGISGKYSSEYMDVKMHQVNDNSKTTRTHFRNTMYTITIDPTAQLHPTFKSMVYEIASYLQSNQTEVAQYCAELLVKDYGTHIVNSIDVGAVFAKVDHLAAQYAAEASKESLQTSASASFPGFLLFNGNINLNFSNELETVRTYKANQVASNLFTIGGPPITPDMNITSWLEKVANNLAIVDRRGKEVHFAVSPSAFPELADTLVWAISDTIKDAVNRYYSCNTVRGCTDPRATNFDFQANFDDNSCNVNQSPTTFAFGGIYQDCRNSGHENLCPMFSQSNPIVGNNGCPQDYTAVLLTSGSTVRSNVVPYVYRDCGWWSCDYETRYRTEVSRADNSAYWCVPLDRPDQHRELLFGGYYTRENPNPFTGDHSCPSYFTPLRLGESSVVCVSNDYELGIFSAVKFGGFYSCRSGNPLSVPTNSSRNDPGPTTWRHSCPTGYAQHLISIEYNCEVIVCLEVGAFNSRRLMHPRLPPFRSRPSLNEYGGREGGLIVQGSRDNLVINDNGKEWTVVKRNSNQAITFIESINISVPMLVNNPSDNDGQNITTVGTDTPANTTGSPLGASKPGSQSGSSHIATASIVISIITTFVAAIFIGISIGICFRNRAWQRNQNRGQHPLNYNLSDD